MSMNDFMFYFGITAAALGLIATAIDFPIKKHKEG